MGNEYLPLLSNECSSFGQLIKKAFNVGRIGTVTAPVQVNMQKVNQLATNPTDWRLTF